MKEVLAVIVTFNPSIGRLSELINSLVSQNVNVLVVDNNSSNKDSLDDISSKVEVNLLTQNFGIAFAQNVGIEKAIKEAYEFILFFDQDSNVDADFVHLMHETYSTLNRSDVCCISPRFYNDRYGFYYDSLIINKFGFRKRVNLGDITSPYEVSLVISSGSFVPVSAIKKIGGMKASFFIDAVDTEWCFRAINLGYKIFVSDKAIMKHTIGDEVIDLKFKKVSVHSPFRRYYIIRNNFYLLKLKYVPKIFSLRDICMALAVQVLFIISLPNRRKDNVKALLNAVKDGAHAKE